MFSKLCNQTETLHGTLTGTVHGTFPVISSIVWNMSENLHYESDGYISKSYSTCKNTIDRQYTERGQL